MEPQPHRSPLACTVRPPRAQDHARMAELAGQLGYPSSAEAVRTRLERMRDPETYAVYVAELADGRLAGWMGVHLFRTVESDPQTEISGLVVDEALRSRGVGRALLEAAEAWARARGCDTVSVRSNVKRERAHAFYERNGYVWTKSQKTLRKRVPALG